MLLAIDAGNTHTVTGILKKNKLINHWRLPTDRKTTPDKIYADISTLIESAGINFSEIEKFVFCSVVPELSHGLAVMGRKMGLDALNVDEIKKSLIKINYDYPETVGSDRIANAVAVKSFYGAPAIVIDFGTATTFDVIGKDGSYDGGAIAPGVQTSINGLLDKAAQLYDIRLESADSAIGRNTKESISAGFLLGLGGLADGLVGRIERETGEKPKVIATGGFSALMAPYCDTVQKVDADLTLKGLAIIFESQESGVRSREAGKDNSG